jgi:hypothetical protein
MQVLQCARSGIAPTEPLLCCKTGLVFERSLIEAEVRITGMCPVTKILVDFDKDFVKIRAPKYNTHGGFQETTAENLEVLKESVESQISEAVKLKAEAAELKLKLKNVLTKQAARVEVIKKLATERDALRNKLSTGSSSRIVDELMQRHINDDSDFNWKSSLYHRTELFQAEQDKIFGNQTIAANQTADSIPKNQLANHSTAIMEKLRKEISSQIEANSLRLNRIRKQVTLSKQTDPYLTAHEKPQRLQVSLKSALADEKGEYSLLGYHPNNPELALLFGEDIVVGVDLSIPEEGMTSSTRGDSQQTKKVKVSKHRPSVVSTGRRVLPVLLSKFCYDDYSFGIALIIAKEVEVWEVKLELDHPEALAKSRKLFSVSFNEDVSQITTHPLERLLIVSHGENISLIDFASRSLIQTYHVPLGEVEREENKSVSSVHHVWLECHPDGTLVSWSTNQGLRKFGLLNIATGEILTQLESSIDFVSNLFILDKIPA